MNRDRFNDIMRMGLRKLTIEYKEDNLSKLWLYMNFLLTENEKYNLTGITAPEEIISKHFLDSLAPLPLIDPEHHSSVIDVGTGAGFPGLIYRIFLPSIRLLLLDATLKKVNFLKMLASRLEIEEGLEIIHSRAEELARGEPYRENFDYVLARAVAPVNVLCEYTIPFLKQGGKAVFYKGPEYKKELKDSVQAVTALGGELAGVKNLKVPGLKGERYIIIIDKITATPGAYPRRPGMAKKRPL